MYALGKGQEPFSESVLGHCKAAARPLQIGQSTRLPDKSREPGSPDFCDGLRARSVIYPQLSALNPATGAVSGYRCLNRGSRFRYALDGKLFDCDQLAETTLSVKLDDRRLVFRKAWRLRCEYSDRHTPRRPASNS